MCHRRGHCIEVYVYIHICLFLSRTSQVENFPLKNKLTMGNYKDSKYIFIWGYLNWKKSLKDPNFLT